MPCQTMCYQCSRPERRPYLAFEYSRHNALFAENGIWIDLNRDGEVGDDYRIVLNYP